MSWKIGQAKQRFSEVVKLAAKEPQVIRNRDRVVAVLVSPEDAARLQRPPSVGQSLAELRALCSETGYELVVPTRTNRKVSFDWPADVSRRHKRHQ